MLQMQIAELTDSTDIAHDGEALRARFQEDGYVFLRDQLDPEMVSWAREQACGKLAEDGLIEDGDLSAKWTGSAKVRPEPCDALGNIVWDKIVADPALNRISSALVEDELSWVPIVRHRCALPTGPEKEGEDLFAGRHQDSVYNKGLEFAICWLPLMDIPRARGGLAIATGLLDKGDLHVSVDPYYIPKSAIPFDAWRTTDFRPGDVLIFNKSIPHAGLRNMTDNIRLSVDLRVIAKSAPQPIFGEVTEVANDNVTIRTEAGETKSVRVNGETFIRDLVHKYELEDLSKVAFVGANVMAVADRADNATLMRTIKY